MVVRLALRFLMCVITIGIFTSLCMAQAENIVGLWHLDEGFQDVAKDSSGNGNDGAISGAKWVDGKFGKSLQFEFPDVVTIPPSLSLDNIKDSITVAAWINLQEGVSDTAIRRNGVFLLEVQSPTERVPGAFVFGIWSAGSFTGGVWGETVPKFDEWHHLVGLYDGREMRLYFDGQIEATVPQTGKIDTPAENLLLGTFGGEKFIGKLDEVAIYNKALTDEITIAAWIKMSEGVSDTAIRRQGGYLLEVQSTSERAPGAFVFGIWSSGAFTGGVWGKIIPKKDEWRHIVGLYDGKEMRLYFDGALEATVKQTGKIDSPADNLLFGTFGGEQFFGTFDEIVIFNKGLSEEEIKLLMKGVKAAQVVIPSAKLLITWARIKEKR